MPVISPSAFAPPVSRAANDATPLTADLRERIRRLERAHSAQRAGQAAVPLGVPADRRAAARRRAADRRPARDRGGARRPPAASPPTMARRWASPPILLGRFAASPRHPAVVPPPVGRVRCAALCPRALRLVRSGAAADGHGAARRGSVLGDGRGPALSRHRRRAGRDARRRSHRRPPPVARRREERRACPAAALPAGANAKRLRDALARRLGAVALDARPQRHRRPRWRLELRRNRFGTPSADEMPSWLVEWNDETHCLAVVPQALHGSAGAHSTRKTGRLGPPPPSSGATAARVWPRSTPHARAAGLRAYMRLADSRALVPDLDHHGRSSRRPTAA